MLELLMVGFKQQPRLLTKFITANVSALSPSSEPGKYCLFGDTVNTASRMESHSPVGRIHCSESAVLSAQQTGRFEFESRGKVQIKGKGEMNTYFLLRSYKRSIWEVIHTQRDENVNSIDGYQELRDGFVDNSTTKKSYKHSSVCVIS
ncbi:hypothetical protein RB195_024611 [Necator americanus]|uniref:Guanylate cyclase domain-containing protein n=1 Tax=Necator americanus TaxID=51031 RepID=A0ABR1ENZ3_NECAM